jgi:hypothetical protein
MDYVVDIETDGIEATKIWCLVVDDGTVLTSHDDMRDWCNNLTDSDRIIGHNFQRYDKPTLERILGVTIQAQIVDTLALSWYLFPNRIRHGLEYWGEDLGVAKPEIEDWENLSLDEYVHRCKEDVKINSALWEPLLEKLQSIYGEDYNRLIDYLSFKMKCAEMQEYSRWKLDVDGAKELLTRLEAIYEDSKAQLESVMPKVPKMVKRTKPKVMYRKAKKGEEPIRNGMVYSKAGLAWLERLKAAGKPEHFSEEIEEVAKYEEPNAGSSQQLKDWLFSIGWSPATFKFVEDRKIPQIKKDDDLCPSIQKLADKHPEVELLSEMTVVKHRIGLVSGLLDNVDSDGFVQAKVQGLTNTLRFKHAVCVNLPSLRKPYGKEIRGLLTARDENFVLCGSDMASLEDRTKQHYMWEYDPEYVSSMLEDGFDPHLDIAVQAGMMTQQQADGYKQGEKTKELDKIRYNAKTANYASTYGAGAPTIARQAGMTEKEARTLHSAYWERNWSLKSIAENATTKQIGEELWLFNPVSKLWYSLRHEKDIFSTLNQGTGTFCFDMWVGFVLKERPQLTAQFHDEIILEIGKNNQERTELLLRECVQKVNKVLKLNRDLDIDVQFGTTYADIH